MKKIAVFASGTGTNFDAIASACADLGIGMGVGSERAGIAGVCPESFSVVKEYDVPLVIGNVGAPQLVRQKGKDPFRKEDVEAAMAR